MTNKNFLIAIEKDAIGNITAVDVFKYMMVCQGGMFRLDNDKTDNVNKACKNMIEGTTYAVFATNSHELYTAIIHTRLSNGRVEVFNITSDDNNYSQLDKKQITEIVDAFKGFIGWAIVEKMNLKNGDLLN